MRGTCGAQGVSKAYRSLNFQELYRVKQKLEQETRALHYCVISANPGDSNYVMTSSGGAHA